MFCNKLAMRRLSIGALGATLGCGSVEDGHREPLELGVARQALGSSEQVTTVNSLRELRNMTLTGNYRLGRDIDARNTSRVAFEPIGDRFNPFRGTFDGDGHTIRNLRIDGGADSTGLFARTEGALILDVHLSNLEVRGHHETGGLVGTMWSSEIHGCSVQGRATADFDFGPWMGVGLLVGVAYGENLIERSWTVGTVDGNIVVGGGLVGGAFGLYDGFGPSRPVLREVFANVTVDLQAQNGNAKAGGIAGEAEGADLISVSARGSVRSYGYAGGLVGEAVVNPSFTPPGILREAFSRASVEVVGVANRAGAIGHHNNTFAWCGALWDSTIDPGSPPAGSDGCQEGFDSRTLARPRMNPNDPLYFPFIFGQKREPGEPGFPNGSDGAWDFGIWDLRDRLRQTILKNIPSDVQVKRSRRAAGFPPPRRAGSTSRPRPRRDLDAL